MRATEMSDRPDQDDAIDMAVNLAGMRLPNPLMTASGCAANGRELHRFFDIAELGAFVTKTVLADPRSLQADRVEHPARRLGHPGGSAP